MSTIRVLLADDHALFRRGVASLLAAESDFHVVGKPSTAGRPWTWPGS